MPVPCPRSVRGRHDRRRTTRCYGVVVNRAAILSLVAAVVVAACAGSGASPAVQTATAIPPTATPTATSATASSTPIPTPEPTSQAFVSDRHGYRAVVPPGWAVTEYPGTWTDLAEFAPAAEVPGEDVIAPPDLSAFVVVDSMAIPPDMTADEWSAAFAAKVDGAFTETCPGTRRDGTLAGEPAMIVDQPCEGSIITGRSLTHSGRGYYFTSRVGASDGATAVILDDIVVLLEFVED